MLLWWHKGDGVVCCYDLLANVTLQRTGFNGDGSDTMRGLLIVMLLGCGDTGRQSC